MNIADPNHTPIYQNINFWRTIAEQAADVILGIHLDGTICYANQSASHIYGYSQQELHGMHIAQLRAPESKGDFAAQFAEAKQTGILFRTKHVRKDGQIFPVEVNSRCVDMPEGQVVLSIIRDNTVSEKNAEEARVTKAFADTLIQAANVIIMMINHQGGILLFNDTAQIITGYSAEEAIGQDVFEFLIEPELRQELREHFLTSLTPGHIGEHGNPILTKSGERRVISWQNCTIGEQPGLCNMLSFGIDITDCLETQANLRRQENFIREVVEGLMFPFFVLDRNYCYLTFNAAHQQRMKALVGADIAIGESLLSYHNDPVIRERMRHNMDNALAGNSCVVEAILGEKMVSHVLVEHSPVRDLRGDVIGVAVVTHEIGTLRSAEAELQASNQRYRHLVENAPAIILVVSNSGDIKYINPFGAKVFGFEPDELVGKSVEGTIAPEIESTGRNLWVFLRGVWSGPAREINIATENITRRGRRLWLDWSICKGCSPLTGNQGWLCMGVDVTAKHRAMERLMRHRRQNEIMNDIIAGRIPEEKAIDFFQAMGLDLHKNIQCFVIALSYDATAMDKQEQSRLQQEQLAEQWRILTNGIVWESMGCVGILIQCRESDDENRLNELMDSATALWQKAKQARGDKNLCGVGVAFKLYPDISIRQLYYQAYSALEFGQCLNPEKTVRFWHELGWIRLLIQNVHTKEAKRYVQEHLGKLINLPDAERRDVLLATMKKVLSGTPVDDIAAQMCIHKQTIRYRLSVIEKLLGADGIKGENAVNTAIALKLYEMQKNVHRIFPTDF